MRKIIINKKEQWDFGTNTYLTCITPAKDGFEEFQLDWWLSSTKMMDGTTLYNVYVKHENDYELVSEDDCNGYWKIINNIKKGGQW